MWVSLYTSADSNNTQIKKWNSSHKDGKIIGNEDSYQSQKLIAIFACHLNSHGYSRCQQQYEAY